MKRASNVNNNSSNANRRRMLSNSMYLNNKSQPDISDQKCLKWEKIKETSANEAQTNAWRGRETRYLFRERRESEWVEHRRMCTSDDAVVAAVIVSLLFAALLMWRGGFDSAQYLTWFHFSLLLTLDTQERRFRTETVRPAHCDQQTHSHNRSNTANTCKRISRAVCMRTRAQFLCGNFPFVCIWATLFIRFDLDVSIIKNKTIKYFVCSLHSLSHSISSVFVVHFLILEFITFRNVNNSNGIKRSPWQPC